MENNSTFSALPDCALIYIFPFALGLGKILISEPCGSLRSVKEYLQYTSIRFETNVF
jgi:hypothetical protein